MQMKSAALESSPRKWLLTLGLCWAGMNCMAAAQVIQAERKVEIVPIPGVESMTQPELMERLLADALVKSEEQKTRSMKLQMDVITGDLKRVIQLSPDKLRRLEIAAKGAVNETLNGWRAAQENQVRQLSTGATAESLPQRLAGVGEMQMGNESPQTKTVWTSSLAKVLSPEESTRWKKLETERADYRHQAIAALLLAELERKLSLSGDQMEKLEPYLKQAFQDYLPDMSSYMDRGGGLDVRMLTLMVNAVSEPVQASILTADQMSQWRTLTADFSGWWQSIQQNHLRRTAGKP